MTPLRPGVRAHIERPGPLVVHGWRVVVVGAARSGAAAARLLRAHGAHVVVSDARESIEQSDAFAAMGIDVELGGHRRETLLAADLVVLSPGVPPRQAAIDAARDAGVPIVGELELASHWLQGPVVAVTGTKGKSTTTTLVGIMLERAARRAVVGGNIGAPLSGQVALTGPDVVHVVEASSFQLESTLTFHPHIAVLLNFSADHLDRHASEQEYAEAKARVFANQDRDDWAVVNADDQAAVALSARARARRVTFSLERAVDHGTALSGGWIVWSSPGAEPERLVPLSAVRVIGRHLLADVLAAAAAARVLGVSPEAMRHAVEGFAGLEHALEPAGEVAGVRFVNDSKATNVEAARRAIESFAAGLVVIVGGKFKGGDLRDLRNALTGRAVAVVAIGEATPLVHQACDGAVTVVDAGSMADAVRQAHRLAPPGGTVLLAPACASFDMFRDYAERGRVFKQEVARLVEAAREDREQ